jgi:hypothetical protein
MPRLGRFTPEKETWYPFYMRLAGGPVWTGVKILAHTGIRSPNRPARSESLYRLRYPGAYIYIYIYIYREKERDSWDAERFEGCTLLSTNTDRELRKARCREVPSKFLFSAKLTTAMSTFPLQWQNSSPTPWRNLSQIKTIRLKFHSSAPCLCYYRRRRLHSVRKHMIFRVRAKSNQGLGSGATVYAKMPLGF